MGSGIPHYVQFGFISITVPNIIVLSLMILVFAAALVLRLPEEDTGGTRRENSKP